MAVHALPRIAVATLLFALVQAQSQSTDCPSTVPQCKCQIKFNRYHYLYCENLDVDTVPVFTQSDQIFTECNIRSGSKVRTIQTNAFANIKCTSLMLQDIGVRTIQPGAFNGLENHLEQLHLDSNELTSVPTEAFQNLRILRYLAMPNNAISRLEQDAFAGLQSLDYLYVFGNRIDFVSPLAFRGLSNLQGLSLHRNRMKSLPSNLLSEMSQLRELELHHNNLTQIDSSIFRDTIALERLDLTGNEIVELQVGGFSRLTELRYLAISENRLETLRAGVFNGLPNLKFLYLNQNRISSLAANAFTGLDNLNTLYLYGNQLTDLPNNVFNLQKLKQLHLYSNRLIRINPLAFQNLLSVWDLNLNDNQIQDLGDNPFVNIPNLEYLDLQRNQLSNIRRANWAGVSKIRNIRLQGNRMTGLTSDSFGSIPSLTNLALSGNNIVSITTGALQDLPKLNYLELQNNSLSELKDGTFTHNTQLRTLKLSNNRLTRYNKETWDGLGQLRHLYLENNEITELPSDGLSRLFELLRFFASYNRISRVGERSFHKLRNMELIDLSNNAITWVDNFAFDFQKKLLELKLSYNQLSWIDPDAFVSLLQLVDLDLSYNQFTTFVRAPFNSDMKELKRIVLEGNRLLCNCSVAWMRGFAPVVNGQGASDLRCREGPYFGQRVLCYPIDSCPEASSITLLNETIDICEGRLAPETPRPPGPGPTPTVKPTDFPTVRGPMFCNFDQDMCAFQQIGEQGTTYFSNIIDNFEWTRNSGKTSSSNTGPAGDHTSGSGSYMYIEASDPRRLGERAILMLSIELLQESCLSFWYHMYGSNVGLLAIRRLTEGGNETLWSKGSLSGIRNDEDKWYYGIRTLPAGYHVLFIEGTRANGYAGDIAIDDWSISDGACAIESGEACPDKTCKNGGRCQRSAIRDMCSCPDVYSGPFCEISQDPCLGDPCGPNAINCEEREDGGGIICNCKEGWEGPRCTIRTDPCRIQPCKNGATCERQSSTVFTCSCVPGYEGNLCSDEINNCRSNPCQNGAACFKTGVNQYRCDCLPGWEGPQCQNRIDPCRERPCQNQGECVPNGLTYRCNCPPEFNGNNCENRIDPCASAPCKNGAACEPNRLAYRCTCTPGWTGENCDNRINFCEEAPCLNGATCTNLATSYQCTCVPGYQGIRCENKINYCEGSPCLNGATCNSLQTQFECACVPGYRGARCEEKIDYCFDNPCKNGAVCASLQTTFQCTCPPQFEGPTCALYKNPCLTTPCKNNAQCNWSGSGPTFTCTCTAEFEGPVCDKWKNPCLTNPCRNGGQCQWPRTGSAYTCQCPAEWTGNNCEIRVDPCSSVPCRNGATCVAGQGLQFTCQCQPNFRGTRCEFVRPCSSNPCQNNGACVELSDTALQCDCLNGFAGSRCETYLSVGACASRPCLNGGQCFNSDESKSGYVCQCPSVGSRCEGSPSDPCSPSPCQNGAKCYRDGVSGFYCACQRGFSGPTCGTIQAACASGPCLNGGVCTDVGATFTCQCATGFTGRHCQMRTALFPPMQFRLMDGPNPLEGRLEVNVQNRWGTVCSDRFDNTAAQIVCKALGYSGGVVYTNGPPIRNPQTPILLDGVKCDYNAYPSLMFCEHNEIGVTDCQHAQDVAIRCVGTLPPVTPPPTSRPPPVTPSPTPATTPSPPTVAPPTGRPLPGVIFKCDFERDTCGLIQEPGDDFDWTRNFGGTPSGATGPGDGRGGGYYMYTEASSPRRNGDAALIRLPSLTDISMCLTFYYHMFGANMGMLTVKARYSNGDRDLWSKSGNQGDVWLKANVTIPPNAQNIAFEGKMGLDYLSDMALDDITVTFGTCAGGGGTPGTQPPTQPPGPQTTLAPTQPPPSSNVLVDCNFDRNGCSSVFTQTSTVDQFDWTRRNGGTPSSGTGPPADHTSGTGSYMYIETSDPRLPGDRAHLDLNLDPAAGGAKCLRFWYHMNGGDIGQLLVLAVGSQGQESDLLSLSGNRGDTWFEANVTVPATAPTIRFVGVRGRDYQGDLAIDDVVVTAGGCNGQAPTSSPTPVPPGPQGPQLLLQCDFERSSQCQFNNVQDDDFNWVLAQENNTPSGNTGPSRAHSGTFYGFIETSSPRVPGEAARLQSLPARTTPGPMCLKFWYNMNGVDVGELNAYIKEGDTLTRIWALAGNQEQTWYEGMAEFQGAAVFSVVLEAVRGADYRGDIAIDDIKLFTGRCWDFSQTQLCDFEGGTCYLQQTTSDTFDWMRGLGSTNTGGTGPIQDRSGIGYYMYVESSDKSQGDTATLETPRLAAGTYCFSMYYHMFGTQVGSLTLQTSDGPTDLISLTGEQGNQWLLYRGTVSGVNPFTIRFIATVGAGARGDIAIDDVSISPGPCAAT